MLSYIRCESGLEGDKMSYNKIRIPLLTALVILMILDLSGIIHVPFFVILIIALALIWYNIHIRRNAYNKKNNDNK